MPLQVDCHVPLQAASVDSPISTSTDIISELRQYLTLCRGLEYTLTPPMQTVSVVSYLMQTGLMSMHVLADPGAGTGAHAWE